MRYYWEALFSVEYFPYWEFTMLMVLILNLAMLWRLHRIESKIDALDNEIWEIFKEMIEIDAMGEK